MIAALLALSACNAETAGVVAPEVPDDVVRDTTGNGAVRAALVIDPANLPVYAGVGLPTYYTATVLQREDRTPLRNPLTNAAVRHWVVCCSSTRG